MRGAANAATRMIRRVGMVEGLPRIFNVDASTYTIGYTEINTMATTAFSRTKTHKGWLVGDTDIIDGTRIIDRVDNSKYLVMSLKPEYSGGSIAFIDGTLFFVNEVCSVSRLGTDVDDFGRVTGGYGVVQPDVWIMVNPIVVDVIEQPEKIIGKDKIKIAMQASVDIRTNDRITTSTGEIFKVLTFSKSEVENLLMAYVETDTR